MSLPPFRRAIGAGQASPALTRSWIAMSRLLVVAFVVLSFIACSAGGEARCRRPRRLRGYGGSASSRAGPQRRAAFTSRTVTATTVTVYSADGKSKLRTITNGVAYPNALTFNRSGSLYVGNYGSPSGSSTSSVAVYPRGGDAAEPYDYARYTWPLCACAFGSAAKLYVANRGGATVTVYKPRFGLGASDDRQKGAFTGGASLQ